MLGFGKVETDEPRHVEERQVGRRNELDLLLLELFERKDSIGSFEFFDLVWERKRSAKRREE